MTPQSLTTSIHSQLENISESVTVTEREKKAGVTALLGTTKPLPPGLPYSSADLTRRNGTLCYTDHPHLHDHFKTAKFLNNSPSKKMTSTFIAPGSFYDREFTLNEMLDRCEAEGLLCIINSFDVAEEKHHNKIRSNTICYIYDPKKYGFVKTGEVIDTKTEARYPAYAIMIVTEEDGQLTTIYPLKI